jgi:hypothetical protein
MTGPMHAPRVPFVLLLLGLLGGGMCTLLLLNTASAANEVRRHDLAVKDAGIAAQVQQLRNQVAASSAPGALGSAAAQLGMVPAGNPAFLEIGPNGSVRVLGSPAAVVGEAVAPAPAPAPVRPAPVRRAATSTHPASVAAGHAGAARTSATRAPKTVTKTVPVPSPTTTLGGTR